MHIIDDITLCLEEYLFFMILVNDNKIQNTMFNLHVKCQKYTINLSGMPCIARVTFFVVELFVYDILSYTIILIYYIKINHRTLFYIHTHPSITYWEKHQKSKIYRFRLMHFIFQYFTCSNNNV